MSQSRTVEDPGKAVRLLLPIPLSKTYTYHVPQSLRNYDKLQIGSLVRVAFSGKEHTALVRQVVNLEEVEGSFSLKDIKYIYDYAPLSSGFLKFFDFFSNFLPIFDRIFVRATFYPATPGGCYCHFV